MSDGLSMFEGLWIYARSWELNAGLFALFQGLASASLTISSETRRESVSFHRPLRSIVSLVSTLATVVAQPDIKIREQTKNFHTFFFIIITSLSLLKTIYKLLACQIIIDL